MATHRHTTPPSRRRLFGGALALTCAPAAAPALTTRCAPPSGVHPDAGLLAACSEFLRLESLWLATDWQAEPGTVAEAAVELEKGTLLKLQESWMERVCSLRASTFEGVFALGACVSIVNQDAKGWPDDPDGYQNERLLAALMRALAAVQASPSGAKAAKVQS